MKPIRGGFARGWRAVVEREDGTKYEIEDFARLTAINPEYSRITIGEHPNGGYDTWAKHERGGGGSVIVPFCWINGGLYVGLIKERRMLQTEDGYAWNAPMGYLEPGKSHFETALEEFSDEVGMKPQAERVQLLPGEGGNHENSNVETWGKRPDGEPEGVQCFSYEFILSELEPISDGRWKPRQELKPLHRAGEKVLRCEFMPWREAAIVGDMQTALGILRLVLLHL